MLPSRWLHNLLGLPRSSQDRHRQTARRHRRVRPMLEALEDRITPTLITENAADIGALQTDLKNATAANTQYVINLTGASAAYELTAGSELAITTAASGSNISIVGTGQSITGNGNRVLFVGKGADVTLQDLTLTNGSFTNAAGTAEGGGIYDFGGNVTLSAVSVQDDSVAGNLAEGGGIFVSGGGNLTIKSGSVIQSNSATGGSFAAGGGVYVFGDSTVAISDSTLNKNSVVGAQGANGASAGANGSDGGTAYGGGLDVNGSGWTVTLTGDMLSGNTLIAGNGGNGAAGQNASGTNGSGGNGGNGGQGGFATGGGGYFFVSRNGSGHLTILNDPTTQTTKPSQFLDNSIQSGAGGNGGAGGTSTGTANNANGGNGGVANQAVGGALFISSAAGGAVKATISNTTFSGNKVSGANGGRSGAAGAGGTGSGGATGTNQGGSFAEGGAIVLENSVSVTMNNSTVVNNTVGTSSGVADLAQGGGISNFGGSFTLSKVTVEGNTAAGAVADGGGIFVSAGALTMQGGSVVQSNRVTGANFASGGGIYVLGPTGAATTIALRDSIVSNNSAQGEPGANGTSPGSNGGNGGNASGGGLFVAGSGWTATLTGVALSGNSVVGGNGGKGAAGSNAIAANASGGKGGNGGGGGSAFAGAAYFVGDSGSHLTILDDPAAPAADPSIMIANSVQSGAGGNGGAGGASTGTANNSNGGDGGFALGADGGALFLSGSDVAVNIGNTTLYGNKVLGGNPGSGGTAGTGGAGTAGNAGANLGSVLSSGGGLDLEGGSIRFVGNTVAENIVTAGFSDGGAGSEGAATGGGILVENFTSPAVFDNNTITQNTISGGIQALGSGVYVPSSNLTLVNNLIQGNQSLGLSANDLETFEYTLDNASNNFITSTDANAVNTTSNIIGKSQTQLGGAVGVTAGGKPSGGPIYYPLLPGAVSVGAGSTSDLSTIAAVEGTATAHASDEIGNPFSTSGPIDLGAVQFEPVITSNPASQTVTAGSSVSFTASAGGTPAPMVQWQVSTDVGHTFVNIGGATNTTLTLNNVGISLNGNEYRAVFTNGIGTTTSTAATLTVNSPPSPPPSPTPPVLRVPPLLALFDQLLGGTETVNANGTETITDSLFGIPLLVSTFDSTGNLVSVDLFGFNITFLFV